MDLWYEVDGIFWQIYDKNFRIYYYNKKQTSFQYIPEAPTCNAATKHITSDVIKKHFMMHAFVQVKTQKQGFHNISHLQWHVYIKHPWNICNPPWNQMQWTFRESNYQNYSGCKLTHMDISAMGRDFTLPKLNNKALHGPSVFIQWTI